MDGWPKRSATRAQCVRCHNGPLLTNGGFHNIGLSRRGTGAVDVGRAAGEDAAQQVAKQPAAKESGDGFRLKVGEARVDGDNLLSLRDDAVDPPFHLDMKVSEVTASGIDSGQPDLARAELETILREGTKEERAWAISHLLRFAQWDDIWLYVSREEVREIFPTLELPETLRQAWARMLKIEAPVGT